ncbi:MAG: hypothetical protein JJE30_08935 [Desulfuromonadales bacterium]|nr:hypothetical protein [Desulfuromonadales bacterium]
MNAETAGKVFSELDVCRSLFDSLAHTLEYNVGVRDYHPLSVLAQEGKRKIDSIVDQIDRGRMAA